MNFCQGQTTVCTRCDLTPPKWNGEQHTRQAGHPGIRPPRHCSAAIIHNDALLRHFCFTDGYLHSICSFFMVIKFYSHPLKKSIPITEHTKEDNAHAERVWTYGRLRSRISQSVRKKPDVANTHLHSKIIWSPFWVADQTLSSNFTCHGLHEHKCSSAPSLLTSLPHICCIILHNHLTPGCSI